MKRAVKNTVPLCVDLDGTLIKTDLLVESFFQLLKHNFETVYGTDSNPNAIIGLSEGKKASKIVLKYGDLFADLST